MGSTDLQTYLNYMMTWETESDENIDKIIDEQRQFIGLTDFQSDSAVESVFQNLHDLACTVRDVTIAADATQMAADAAAVASIWSFGLGMAAFVALEAAEVLERAVISSKSKELTESLTSADTDISKEIGPEVANYVGIYKTNNNIIRAKATKGMDTKNCRAFLMQFMATSHQKSGKLDAATFRQYAASARVVFNSPEIDKVYDALDKLNLSAKTDNDVKNCLHTLVGINIPNAKMGIELVLNLSFGIMAKKMKIAQKTIQTKAVEAGLEPEEVSTTTFEAMDAVGKFTAGIIVIIAVVDVILNIIDIVDVVHQCHEMCDNLDGTIKTNYKIYFNSIRASAQQYKKAIGDLNEKPTIADA